MYHHILIATDGSERARHALLHALTLGKAVGASVTVLTATEPWTATEMATRAALGDRRPIDDYEREAQVMAQRILDAARDKASLAYAWEVPVEGSSASRYFAVLHQGRVRGPADALSAVLKAMRGEPEASPQDVRQQAAIAYA